MLGVGGGGLLQFVLLKQNTIEYMASAPNFNLLALQASSLSLKLLPRASEMDQLVDAIVNKPGNWSSVPGHHMVERDGQLR